MTAPAPAHLIAAPAHHSHARVLPPSKTGTSQPHSQRQMRTCLRTAAVDVHASLPIPVIRIGAGITGASGQDERPVLRRGAVGSGRRAARPGPSAVPACRTWATA